MVVFVLYVPCFFSVCAQPWFAGFVWVSSISIIGNWAAQLYTHECSCDPVWGVKRVACTSAKQPVWRAFITIVWVCGAARVGLVQVCAVDMSGETPVDRFFMCYLGSQVVRSCGYRCATK